MASKTKKPKSAATSAGKRPVDSMETPYSGFIKFRFDRIDLGSEWDLGSIDPDDFVELLEFLKNISQSTIHELRNSTGTLKVYDNLQTGMNPEAIKRLAEGYEGQDFVHRLRVSGKKRLYGILDESVFSILWWDPEHKVWPTKDR